MPTKIRFQFPTSAAAWAFMRAADSSGVVAGFPSTDGEHTVAFFAPEERKRFQAVKDAAFALGGGELLPGEPADARG